MSLNKKYMKIIRHYEHCLEKYGDSHLGVDWPSYEDAQTRYRIMMEALKSNDKGLISVLDFGCGAGHLYEYILRNDINNIEYRGLDISHKFIELCKSKFPDLQFTCADILDEPNAFSETDYIIMNGVFTEKRELEYVEMLEYFKEVIKICFNRVRKGMAFNVMSKYVDWERDDLFHLPFDELGHFLTAEVSRNFVIRDDYGLYEYTVYIYK